MALDTKIGDHLDKRAGVGSAAYTVAGAVATITGTLSASQLDELIRVASLTRHEVVVAAGAVKVQPRT